MTSCGMFITVDSSGKLCSHREQEIRHSYEYSTLLAVQSKQVDIYGFRQSPPTEFQRRTLRDHCLIFGVPNPQHLHVNAL